MTEPSPTLPAWAFVAIALVLLSQSTFLFLDARKRGSRAWLWGIWGLIHFPLPLVVYWIVVRTSWFRKKHR
ncbi:sigmaY antisigma factor component [Paenibacillus flagellatus]|uniref:SigmaY antisigma factor component n=1 Tax=Paenibacillus flagellatus TaxID=2211139 RepID=A0A2V5KRS3_9BACL|nr:sigmaY antisigma factor component [Paenibacillus flagellatus]PYI51626.1 sigmaY antisigma factor component [Paenibacillus flagellatus]